MVMVCIKNPNEHTLSTYALGIPDDTAVVTKTPVTLSIEHLATASDMISNDAFSNISKQPVVSAYCCQPGMFTAGTFNVTTPYLAQQGNAPVSITFRAGQGLFEVMQEINAVQQQSGMEASTLSISAPMEPGERQYVLSLHSITTGKMHGIIIEDPDKVLAPISFKTVSNSTDAVYYLNEVMHTHPNNTVTDVLPGVDLQFWHDTTSLALPLELYVVPNMAGIAHPIVGSLECVAE